MVSDTDFCLNQFYNFDPLMINHKNKVKVEVYQCQVDEV